MDYNFYYWGPFLMSAKVNKNICEEMLERGRKTIIKFNKQLAGHIEKENLFDDNDKDWINNNLKEHFLTYKTAMKEHYGTLSFKENANSTGIKIEHVWINFMKSGEFNPPHTHKYDLSFVLFLQVPSTLKKERMEFGGSDKGPGCLQFMYGENHNSMFVNNHTFFPREGDIFIFPSGLKHFVFPFKSDCERVSVSGNLTFTYDSI